jgi:hypothetical protein
MIRQYFASGYCLLKVMIVTLLQVIKMLVIVVALFALCWLPLQTYNVLQYIYPEINQ